MLLSTALGLMAFGCARALAEQPKANLQLGEISVHVLGTLLLDKVRGSVQWSAIPIDTIPQVESDLVMIYRAQVIRCGGFLDELAPMLAARPDAITSIQRTEKNAAMAPLEISSSVLSSMRWAFPDLDARAERFSRTRLTEVMKVLASGDWQIQPPCLSPGYAAQVAQPIEGQSRR
ncbi:hypothetical protein [Variovorax sp. DXTD-1]|uniref:hypothetical protein n=1 Tax=Variovorax sp. DXTD-1 TaxID=2495592 RepID=UPI000F89713C|nr:hypothetical protein [Variovorax sp. DXTD-1]RST49295.1 hypothetical protein EJI00_14670 [Variovorax sp. DXTD-1]